MHPSRVSPSRGRGRPLALVVALAAAGCGRGGAKPSPTSSSPGPQAPSTTAARIPTLTAPAIAGLDPATFHGLLARAGFTTSTASTAPGFVPTTSRRPDATVTTYGRGPADVVKIVAEADTKAAPSVLVTVAGAVAKGAEAKKAEAWLKATLKQGPIGLTQPRAAAQRYADQPFELVVTVTTATLSIGRSA